VQELDRSALYWRNTDTTAETASEIIDLYGVRQLIASLLSAEDVKADDVPGNTYIDGTKQ